MDDNQLRQAVTDMQTAQQNGNQDGALRNAQLAATAIAHAMRQFEQREFEGANALETVKAKVDGKGTVLDLYISPHAIRDCSPEQLGTECIQAVTSARAAMSGQLTERLDMLNQLVPQQPAPAQTSPKELVAEMRRRIEALL